MRLPTFLIVGAQKSGTTWLAAQLRRHRDIFIAPREIHFFDKAHNARRGAGWYAAHFADAGEAVAIGEKTPDYLWANGQGAENHLPDVHRRIHALLPEARLVVVLREPVARAISAVRHLMRTRRVSPREPLDRLLSPVHPVCRAHGVLAKGCYAGQLAAFLELYPRERLLIFIFEDDVVAAPERSLRRACEFLGVEPYLAVEPGAERNESRRSRLRLLMDYYLPALRPFTPGLDRLATAWQPRPSAAVLEQLRAFYRPENERLFTLIGRRIPSWEAGERAGPT